MAQRVKDFTKMIQNLVQLGIRLKFSQFGPQIYAFNHLVHYISGLMESHSWDSKEDCGTGAGSCGDTKGSKFGNSKKNGTSYATL